MELDYHTQIYGVTQSGKTYAGLKLLLNQNGLKLFVDTKEEMKYHKYFQASISIHDISKILTNIDSFSDAKIRIVIDIERDLKKQLNEFAKQVFLYQRFNPKHRVTVLIDELQEFVSNRSSMQYIRALFIQGLAKNIRVIFTCQGWSMIQKNIRNNCENTIIFKQRKNDIDSMMDLGLVPYEIDDRGFRKSLLEFDHKYKAYMEIGIGGEFGVLQ